MFIQTHKWLTKESGFVAVSKYTIISLYILENKKSDLRLSCNYYYYYVLSTHHQHGSESLDKKCNAVISV